MSNIILGQVIRARTEMVATPPHEYLMEEEKEGGNRSRSQETDDHTQV
jgi:hypothetical protein